MILGKEVGEGKILCVAQIKSYNDSKV